MRHAAAVGIRGVCHERPGVMLTADSGEPLWSPSRANHRWRHLCSAGHVDGAVLVRVVGRAQAQFHAATFTTDLHPLPAKKMRGEGDGTAPRGRLRPDFR